MFQRLKRAFRSFFDNPANWQYLGSSTRPPALAGVPMDEYTALAHLPVYAAVNRIATDMSVLDLCLDQLQEQGGWKPALGVNLRKLITFSPDGVITARSWRKATVGHICTWGNSYSEIEFDLAGNVAGLHLLHPDRCNPDIVDGELVYRYQHPNGGGEVMLPPWKVCHFANLSYEGVKGYSPIALARETLALGKAADLFGAAFFGNGARPGGVVESSQKLSEIARKNKREYYQNLHGGPVNAGRWIVTDEGDKFTPLSIAPDEAQFIETRKMSVEDVNRLFGLPSKEWGDLESARADYLQTTLLGICSILESELEFKCFTPEQQGNLRIRHDFKPLLRPNAVARASYNATALQWGWLTKNEVREDEGEAPVTGGDNFLVPLNFAQITPTGEIIMPPAPAPSPNDPAQQSPDKAPAPSMTASEDQTAQANSLAALRDIIRAEFHTPAPGSRSAAVDAVAGIVRAELSRAFRREAATIKRAAAKPHFAAALETIYSDHEAYLADALAPSLSALAVVSGKPIDVQGIVSRWCNDSRSQLAELDSVTTSDQRPQAVEQLISSWNARIHNVCGNVEANL